MPASGSRRMLEKKPDAALLGAPGRMQMVGRRMLIDAIRVAGGGYKPRLVFTSSIAVFGAPFPDAIGDEFFHTPLLSYGTQKAIGELLISDYSRRGL